MSIPEFQRIPEKVAVRQRDRGVQNPNTLMRWCWQSEETGCGLLAVGGGAVGGGFRAAAVVFVQQACEYFDGCREVEPHPLHQVDGVEIEVAVEAVAGKIQRVFGYPSGCIFKAHLPPLPNDKFDINDVSNGIIRLSLPGQNLKWPDGTEDDRAKIYNEHLRDQVGLLYFLQNDADVPEKFRNEAKGWGWCKDEFAENGHLPLQLYVREARRMVGRHVYTEKDSEHAPGDARSVRHPEAIAIGDYGNNCHGTAHEPPRFGGKHTGEFYKVVPPYQIPYGVIVPTKVTNLLVVGAVSSSHVGYCALRLEPIWSSLGQAAGHAAHLVIAEKKPVQDVPVAKLQTRLHGVGSAIVYFSDVLPGHADYAAVQWWGTAGGFHGLAATPPKNTIRGKNIVGQYYEAFPHHAAELDKVLDNALSMRWLALGKQIGLDSERLPRADGKLTRGDWIRSASRLAR